MVLNISKVSYSGRLQWSDAYWISKWILEQKTSNILQKEATFDSVTRKEAPTITKHAQKR
jgi:hypothetical protein